MSSTASTPSQPDGRRDRWRAHRENRRAELIAAVLAAVAERGPAIGMDDISSASGIAKPVFYRYFADKTDLFLAVGREVAETVVAEVTAAIDRAATPRAKLEAGIEAYIVGIESNPSLYQFVASHPAQSRATRGDFLGDYATTVGLHAARVIGEILREAGYDSGSAEPWGFGIVGMVRAATDHWLEAPTMSRADLVRYLTDLVWPGLSRSPTGTAAPPG
jgi:AcrR family transcriptional regulator